MRHGKALPSTLGLYKGVLHACGELRDAPLEQLGAADFARVWQGRAAVANNLHRLTLGLPLKFFVLSGSVAALVGTTGQANYAAACGYLEGLTQARQADGLVGCTLHWGPWNGGLAQQRALTQSLENKGIAPFAATTAADAFRASLNDGHPALGVFPGSEIAWRTVLAPAAATPGLGALPRPWVDSRTAASRQQAIETEVGRLLGQVLALNPERIDADKPFGELGMTSLMAIEMRDMLQQRFELRIGATVAFSHPTLRALARFVEARLTSQKATSPTRAEQQLQTKLAELDQL